MASTQQILEAARKLGEQITAHEASIKMEAVLKKFEADTDAQRALNDYNRHAQTLAEKEAAGKPIEVEDKKRLSELQKAVVRNPLLRDLQVVQMDYADLMRRVDEAISGRSAAESSATEPSVSASPLVNPDQ